MAFSVLRDIDTTLYDVTVVSPRNHFVFTPLLPSTTVGTVEFRTKDDNIEVSMGSKGVQGLRRCRGRYNLKVCTYIVSEEEVGNSGVNARI